MNTNTKNISVILYLKFLFYVQNYFRNLTHNYKTCEYLCIIIFDSAQILTIWTVINIIPISLSYWRNIYDIDVYLVSN